MDNHVKDAISFKRSEFSASAESVYFGKVVKAFDPKDCVSDKPCICCPAFVKCNGID